MRTFEAQNGNRVTAIDDVQADAFLQSGLTEVETPQKRGRKEPTE